MRPWLICMVVTIAVTLGATPAGAEECQVVYVKLRAYRSGSSIRAADTAGGSTCSGRPVNRTSPSCADSSPRSNTRPGMSAMSWGLWDSRSQKRSTSSSSMAWQKTRRCAGRQGPLTTPINPVGRGGIA